MGANTHKRRSIHLPTSPTSLLIQVWSIHPPPLQHNISCESGLSTCPRPRKRVDHPPIHLSVTCPHARSSDTRLHIYQSTVRLSVMPRNMSGSLPPRWAGHKCRCLTTRVKLVHPTVHICHCNWYSRGPPSPSPNFFVVRSTRVRPSNSRPLHTTWRVMSFFAIECAPLCVRYKVFPLYACVRGERVRGVGFTVDPLVQMIPVVRTATTDMAEHVRVTQRCWDDCLRFIRDASCVCLFRGALIQRLE